VLQSTAGANTWYCVDTSVLNLKYYPKVIHSKSFPKACGPSFECMDRKRVLKKEVRLNIQYIPPI
jgi:hypothetical protein